jgi:hypothetical protein
MNRNVIDMLKENRGMVAVVMLALLVGVGAGYWLSRGPGSSGGKSDQPIEWHAVQAVPTRAPDSEDIQWHDRSSALDAPEKPVKEAEGNSADAAALVNSAQ